MLESLLSVAMPEVFVSLGSNQQPSRHIISAVHAINSHFALSACSPVYRSKAFGFKGADFLNMVLSFQTHCSAHQVWQILRQIESDHGRCREPDKFTDRTLDADMILYGDAVIQDGPLHLPSREIAERAFVLLPLSQLIPEAIHPILGKNYRQMWEAFCGDRQLTAVELDGVGCSV